MKGVCLPAPSDSNEPDGHFCVLMTTGHVLIQNITAKQAMNVLRHVDGAWAVVDQREVAKLWRLIIDNGELQAARAGLLPPGEV